AALGIEPDCHRPRERSSVNVASVEDGTRESGRAHGVVTPRRGSREIRLSIVSDPISWGGDLPRWSLAGGHVVHVATVEDRAGKVILRRSYGRTVDDLPGGRSEISSAVVSHKDTRLAGATHVRREIYVPVIEGSAGEPPV